MIFRETGQEVRGEESNCDRRFPERISEFRGSVGCELLSNAGEIVFSLRYVDRVFVLTNLDEF